MKKNSLSEMIGGWFVGNFEPVVLNSTDFEVAVKYYEAGTTEPYHYHKIARELTVIVLGEVLMSGNKYVKGDIIDISPGLATDFHAITNCITVVVKTPSIADDKYINEVKK
jgi:anti-sigma factor ChrR (cupin superfamily)